MFQRQLVTKDSAIDAPTHGRIASCFINKLNGDWNVGHGSKVVSGDGPDESPPSRHAI